MLFRHDNRLHRMRGVVQLIACHARWELKLVTTSAQTRINQSDLSSRAAPPSLPPAAAIYWGLPGDGSMQLLNVFVALAAQVAALPRVVGCPFDIPIVCPDDFPGSISPSVKILKCNPCSSLP